MDWLIGAFAIFIILAFLSVPVLVVAVVIFTTRAKAKAEAERLRSLEVFHVDQMSGVEFELFVKAVLEAKGYRLSVTKATGDQGVDLVGWIDGTRVAIQCKCYSSPVSRRAISDVVGGRAFYQCERIMVVTNNYFTKGAIQLAESNNCVLVDRRLLADWITAFSGRDQSAYFETIATLKETERLTQAEEPHAEESIAEPSNDFSRDYTEESELRAQFELFFECPLTSDVIEIRARRAWSGKCLCDWLCFRCADVTFTEIISGLISNTFILRRIEDPLEFNDPGVDLLIQLSPKWWPEWKDRTIEAFYCFDRTFKDGVVTDHVYLWREMKTGFVFAQYLGNR